MIKYNNQIYSSGEAAEGYLKKEYHIKRIDIAILDMVKRLDKSFRGIDRKDIKILELGGATGIIAKKIAQYGYQVIVSDIEESQLKKAEAKGFETSLFDVNFVFPFDDNTFHAIFAGELIEHVFDTQNFLIECNRVLKKKGILEITTPNLATIQDRILFFFGRSPRQINSIHSYLKLHIRPFTPFELKRVVKSFKFTSLKLSSNYIVWRIKDKKVYQCRILAKIFPIFGGSIILSSEKC